MKAKRAHLARSMNFGPSASGTNLAIRLALSSRVDREQRRYDLRNSARRLPALKRSGALIDAAEAETALHAREAVAFGSVTGFMDRHRMKLFEHCGAADTGA